MSTGRPRPATGGYWLVVATLLAGLGLSTWIALRAGASDPRMTPRLVPRDENAPQLPSRREVKLRLARTAELSLPEEPQATPPEPPPADAPTSDESPTTAVDAWLDARERLLAALREAGIYDHSTGARLGAVETEDVVAALARALEYYAADTDRLDERLVTLKQVYSDKQVPEQEARQQLAGARADGESLRAFFESAESLVVPAILDGSLRVVTHRRQSYSLRGISSASMTFAPDDERISLSFLHGPWSVGFSLPRSLIEADNWTAMLAARTEAFASHGIDIDHR